MGKLLCEKNLRDVWCRNKSVRAEIGQILHTHTRAAKLVVEMSHIPSLVRFPRRNRLLSVWVSLISSYVTLGGCP